MVTKRIGIVKRISSHPPLPTLQILHMLVVLLIQTLHILEKGHLAITNRSSSVIKGAIVERVQHVIPVLWIVE
jgi:hypothetical protein